MIKWQKKLVAAALGLLLCSPAGALASVQKDGVHIILLHTNDIHARVLETDDEGKTIGMAWLAGEPDEGALQVLDSLQTETKKIMEEEVAESPRELTAKRELVRTREAELGNLAADAMRWATGAQIAVTNGGGLRANLPQGKVTKGDVLAIFPFGNTVNMVEVKGSAVKAMLEHSVEYLPATFGGFMQVSGLAFDLDPEAAPGSRVKDVQVGGAPLEPDRVYTLAANDFTVAGGDGYTMLLGAKLLGEYGTLDDIFGRYLRETDFKGIEPGRIHVVAKQ